MDGEVLGGPVKHDVCRVLLRLPDFNGMKQYNGNDFCC